MKEKMKREMKRNERKDNFSKKMFQDSKKIPFGRIIPPLFCKSAESGRFFFFFSFIYMIRIRFFGPGELNQNGFRAARYSFSVQYNFPIPLPSSLFLKYCFIGMVFQGECVVLFNFLFCPTFSTERLLIVCICVPSFQNRFAWTFLWKFGFS